MAGLIKDSGDLLSWLQHAVDSYNIKVTNFSDSWSNGLALAALIHRYHPELIDFKSLKKNDPVKNNKLVGGADHVMKCAVLNVRGS